MKADLSLVLGANNLPGKTALEIEMIKAWAREHITEFDELGFNVRVGTGQDPGPAFEPFVRRAAIMLTQKKIDMVGYRGSDITIFEIKARAKLAALGQVVGYRELWRLSKPETVNIDLAVIAVGVDPDTERVLIAQGVKILRVKVPESFLIPPPKV